MSGHAAPLMEHDFEPSAGLPAPLPAGERLLWQGKPDWKHLALRAFHVRAVALYFGLLMLVRGGIVLADGAGVGAAITAALGLLPLLLAAVLILGVLAWATARAAVYTITDKRVVIRCGVALQIAVNLPFAKIGNAAAKIHDDGTADLALSLSGKTRVSLIALWPHVRPWQMTRPEPALRGVPDGAAVAALLAKALAESSGQLPQKMPEAVVANTDRKHRLTAVMGGAGA